MAGTVPADEIRLDRSANGVATLTLNRPKVKNAIGGSMWEELRRIFHEVGHSAGDRVLVVTGAGGDFCSGADLSGVRSETEQRHPLDSMHPVNAAAIALHDVPKPTIAKVNGDAVGAGMNLALGCDLVVAGESARFSQADCYAAPPQWTYRPQGTCFGTQLFWKGRLETYVYPNGRYICPGHLTPPVATEQRGKYIMPFCEFRFCEFAL